MSWISNHTRAAKDWLSQLACVVWGSFMLAVWLSLCLVVREFREPRYDIREALDMAAKRRANN